MVTDYSFNQDKFIEFLRKLSAAVDGEKVYLFLDNCRVHHGKLVKPIWAELNIVPVWNTPYRFQFNEACEKYWAQLKAYFRPLLLMKMLKSPTPKDKPLRDAVVESIRKVSRDSIPKFARRGLSYLETEADAITLRREKEKADSKMLWSDESD